MRLATDPALDPDVSLLFIESDELGRKATIGLTRRSDEHPKRLLELQLPTLLDLEKAQIDEHRFPLFPATYPIVPALELARQAPNPRPWRGPLARTTVCTSTYRFTRSRETGRDRRGKTNRRKGCAPSRSLGYDPVANEGMRPMTRRLTIGILGGMGPLATVDCYRKIIAATPASRDQDHLHVIIDADPTIPDRTAALLEGGPDPTPQLVAAARRLERAGADFLIVPCNTAHAFLDRVQAAIGIPIVSMIEETARRAEHTVRPNATVGLLATSGTIAAGLYQAALSSRGLSVAVPESSDQERVMVAIGRVKAGRLDHETRELVQAVAQRLLEGGAEALILGCTELPLVLDHVALPVPLLDPTRILAEAAVAIALGERPFPALLRA